MHMPLDNPSILTACSTQWASRPDDERYTDLTSMKTHFDSLRERSMGKAVSSRALEFAPDPANPRSGLLVTGQNGNAAHMSHWSLGQMAGLAGAPAGYLRKLPAPLAADCLNYGMKFDRDIEDVGVLLTKHDDLPTAELRAATGPNYGRIWNADILADLTNRFGDGRTGDFRIPGEFGREVSITKDNTTLYASDRDMFVFLADEKNRIEVPNRRNGEAGQMARGFFVWNSEVGSKSLGIAMFLFDFVCMNRIVWGVEQYSEKRIRHTISAPDRWADDVAPMIEEMSMSSAKPIQDTIRAAQERKLDKVDDFLANRFGSGMAKRMHTIHEIEEGRPVETIWDATTAATALARDMPNNDTRVELERKGGALLDLVAV